MSYHHLFCHLVWGTQNREPLLTAEVERVVHNLVRNKAKNLGGIVFALDGVKDHVHLVVSIPPKIAVADFIGQVKGSSSAVYNKTGISSQKFYWQDEYGAFSFDKKRLGNFVAYVKRQKYHHGSSSGDLIPVLERTQSSEDQPDWVTEIREDVASVFYEDERWRHELLKYDVTD